MAGILALSIVVALCVAAVLVGRFAASRAFGVRGFHAGISTATEAGRPTLAFARAGAGITAYYLACVVAMAIGFGLGGTYVVDETTMRVRVAAGGPAEAAGIRDGDRILSVEGEPIDDWQELKKVIAARDGMPTRIVLDTPRGGATVEAIPHGGKILVGPYTERRSLGASELVVVSLREPFRVTTATLRGWARAFGGHEKVEEIGPIGIAKEVGAAGTDAFSTAMKLSAAFASSFLVWTSLGLLALAAVSSRRKTALPTAGNSS